MAVPHQMLMRIPETWSFADAAAVPEVFYTAFINMFIEGELEKGETVLLHGGASGVGSVGIQMAREAGCRGLVTAGSTEKIARCKELGAEFGVNYKQREWSEAVLESYPDGVDMILDISAREYFARNLRTLKPRGRLVIIALLSGHVAEIDLGEMMRRRLRVIGSVLRSRSLEKKIELKHRFEERFWPLLKNGKITSVIDSVLPNERVEDAQKMMFKNRNVGKIILQVRD